VSTVDIGSHMMTVTNNGKVVQTFKDSAGRDKYPSMGGAHIVQYKTADLIMDSQSVGIPRNSPDGYYEHVAQDVNISDGGEFVHAAPWSVGSQGNSNVSHGCVNLAPDNAAWFFNFSQRGDIVNIVNSPRPPELTDNGTVDWNTPWDKWVAGSALPVT
jgi:lipoprotein-anchoring transpeptidase ErfK/SrfK